MKWSQWYYYSLQSKSIYSSSLWFQLLIFCVSSSSPARFSGSFEIPRSNADPRRRRPGSHCKHRRWISALPARGECGGRPRWEVRAPPPTLDGTPDRHPERGDCNSVRAADLFVFSGPSGRLRLRGATFFPGLLLLSPPPISPAMLWKSQFCLLLLHGSFGGRLEAGSWFCILIPAVTRNWADCFNRQSAGSKNTSGKIADNWNVR